MIQYREHKLFYHSPSPSGVVMSSGRSSRGKDTSLQIFSWLLVNHDHDSSDDATKHNVEVSR